MQTETQNSTEQQNPNQNRNQQRNSAGQIFEEPTRSPQKERGNEQVGDTRVDPQYSNQERNNNEDSDNRGNLK